MLAVVAAAAIATFQQPEPVEVRGVWIPNSYSSFFQSRENVETQMALLAEAGVNVVFPVVWSKGHTLFDSEVAEAVVGRRVDPRYGRRDPLAEVLFEAHRHGIEVVPWFEYGFAAGHETYPGKALVTHPEWAAIGVDGQPVVKNGFAWMNSLAPAPQAFLTAMVVECAERYDVDGVQGDDRLPALPAEAGYDPATVARYREEHGQDPPKDIHDRAWTQWRADRLTEYLATLRDAVKEVDGELVFSMAPGAPSWALRDYLQDQKTWVERGLVDALHPQLYTRDQGGYDRMADATLAIEWLGRQRKLVSPGVLSCFRDYVISEELALGSIATNRDRGFAGEVWFYEKGLVVDGGARAKDLGRGPYRRRAQLPWRKSTDWRPKAVDGRAAARDGREVWSGPVTVGGSYAVWMDAAPSAEDRLRGIDLPRWQKVGQRTLEPGADVELARLAPGAARRVLALIDRRAMRRR